MMLSNFFYNYFQSEESQIITIVMILAVIAVSIVLSFVVKKKKGMD